MSRVSYFQRYSQRENHATNNTLLILRRFYEDSPVRISQILSRLIDEDYPIGLSFAQQESGAYSRPDARITQKALRIFFEVKRGGELDRGQIVRHLDTMAETHTKGMIDILIGLTTEPIAETDLNDMKGLANKKGVEFRSVTFSKLIDALRGECRDYERDLLAIVDDFDEYLAGEELLETRDQWLPLFPCGNTYAENKRLGLYFEPENRPCKLNYRFIGLYAEKRVSLIGEVEAIVIANRPNKKLETTREWGELSSDHETRLEKIVDADRYRYYLVRQFHETDIRKTSAGGLLGLRYLDIGALLPASDQKKKYEAEELATLLKGKSFQ